MTEDFASARKLRWIVLCLFVAATAVAQISNHWVGSWAASQQLVEPRNAIPVDEFQDATLRQIVHLSIGGDKLRVRLSNRFGVVPLNLLAVHVARPVAPDSSRIVASSDKELTFSGRTFVIIPAGADYWSDPFTLKTGAQSDLALTIYLDSKISEQTGHPGSRATSYLVHGNSVSAADLPEPKRVDHWYFIASIEVESTANAAAVAVLGDSITDGRGSTTNANNRWTDVLARRLLSSPSTKNIAVLNHGIGGNRLLLDSIGPNALARFDHDVLSQAGVKHLIVLEGINDIGTLGVKGDASPAEHEDLVRRMIAAYEQIITRAHTHGIKVTGCTILPFVGTAVYHPDASSEKDRQTVNGWIRNSGRFDFVVDFDRLMRDPNSPEHMLAKYDSGDHLHPSPEGYAAMGAAVPLSIFSIKSPVNTRRSQPRKPAARNRLE